MPYRPPDLLQNTICPLPIFWPHGPAHFHGTRIDLLPRRFRERVLRQRRASAGALAALRAVDGFETLARDQQEAR